MFLRNEVLKPILNTSLPSHFRQIRLELARESGHPEGDASVGYILVAPLDEVGKIDPMLWRTHGEACRVVRTRPREEDMRGHLAYQKGGSWHFITIRTPARRTTADFSSQSIPLLANMSRSAKAARCILTAWRQCRTSEEDRHLARLLIHQLLIVTV